LTTAPYNVEDDFSSATPTHSLAIMIQDEGAEMHIAWQDHHEAIPASMNVAVYRYDMLVRVILGKEPQHLSENPQVI